ncbi:lysophospholipid acyltransferase family protein [bacterium]|nr:lysophospholipid acyltransferase family protein [bacterium]
MKHSLKHYFEFIILKILILKLRILPYRFAVKLGGFIGRMLWHLGIRRKVSRKNFSLCFPEISSDERDKILKKSYDYFCRSVVEYSLLNKIKNRIFDYVKLDGREVLDGLKSHNLGAILVTGHFGSWELFGAALSCAGYGIDFLVGTQKNLLVDRLMNKMREQMGIGIIHIGIAARGVLKALKSKRMVAMLSDQDAGKSGIVVNFFGHPASTPAGAAIFALKTKCPIVAGYIVRQDDGIHHIGYVRKVAPPEPSGEDEKDVHRLTQFFTEILEEGIRKHPEQYFWAHRRFKTTIKY